MKSINIYLFFYLLLLPLFSGIGEELESIPPVYGQTSWGTEFFLTLPPNDGGSGSNHKVILEITSLEQNMVTTSVSYYGIMKSYPIAANSTQRIELPIEAVQPFIKSLEEGMEDLGGDGVYRRGRALVVSSQKPVTISVTSIFGDTGDSYLALPVHVLGQQYSISTYQTSETEYDFTNNLPAIVSIVGVEDNTKVDFYFNGSPNSKVTSGTKIGEFATRKLSRGDVWIIGTTDIDSDIGGSIVKSDKPVAVISGNQCAEVPLGNPYCDFMMNMEIPAQSWGSEYISLHRPNRKYGNVIRAYPLVDNTPLYVNGALYWNFSEANPTTAQKPFELTRDFTSSDPIYLSSSERFYAIEHSTGTSEDNRVNSVGGPSTQALMPIGKDISDAYLSSGTAGNVINEQTYVRIIYQKDESGEIDFEIAFMPDTTNKLDLNDNTLIVGQGDIDGSPYSYIVLKLPPGRTFKISGRGIKSIQKIADRGKVGFAQPIYLTMETQEWISDTLPPVIDYEILCDGTISGYVEDMPRDNSIRSNVGFNIMQNDSNFVFDPANLNNVPIKSWRLIPQDKSKDAYAELIFWDRRGNKALYPIIYTAPKLFFSDKEIEFGSSRYGDMPEKRIDIENQSIALDIDYKSIHLKNGNHFAIEEIRNRPLTNSRIAAGSVRELLVKYKPLAAGVHRDTLIFDRGCDQIVVAYIVASSADSEILVSDKDLGDIPQNSPLTFSLTVSNLSNVDLTAVGAHLGKNSIFSLNSDAPSQLSKWELGSKAEREISLSVNTSVPGIYQDTLIISSNAHKGDSLGIITVNIKPPGLVAQSFDFGRKRIISNGRTGYTAPTNSYLLQNISSLPIKVEKAYIEGNGFSLSTSLDGVVVNANTSIPIPLEYHPDIPDSYIATLYIDDETGSTTKSRVTGIGTCPKLAYDLPEFEKTVFGDPFRTSFTISNLTLSDWEYGDTLTIDSISVIDKEFYGFEIIDNPFPFSLAPGQSKDIEISLNPQNSIGKYSLEVALFSDACDSEDLILSGEFVEYKTEATSAASDVHSCVGSSTMISVEIHNLSATDITYNNIRLVPDLPQLELYQPLLKEFELGPKESTTIEIEFLSTIEGRFASTLIVSEDKGSDVNINVSGTATSFVRNLTINNGDQIRTALLDTLLISYGIGSTQNDTEETANLIFDIRYDKSMMVPLDNSLRLAEEMLRHGFAIEQVEYDTDIGLIRVFISDTAEPKQGLSNDKLNILEVEYVFFLPGSGSDRITSFESLSEDGCTKIVQASSKIILEGCDVDFRSVSRSDHNDSFEVTLSESSIIFDGSLNYGGEMIIDIVDISGNIIHTVYSGLEQAGNFSYSMQKSDLSSGHYYVRMQKAGNIITQPILLVN